MNFERGRELRESLRIGRAADAVEISNIFASVNVRPKPEQPILNITMSIVSADERFIPLIQRGAMEDMEKLVLNIAKSEMTYHVEIERGYDYLCDKHGKLSATFALPGGIHIMGPEGSILIQTGDGSLKGKDIWFREKLYKYPEDIPEKIERSWKVMLENPNR